MRNYAVPLLLVIDMETEAQRGKLVIVNTYIVLILCQPSF